VLHEGLRGGREVRGLSLCWRSSFDWSPAVRVATAAKRFRAGASYAHLFANLTGSRGYTENPSIVGRYEHAVLLAFLLVDLVYGNHLISV
jgi:hypothetical protein